MSKPVISTFEACARAADLVKSAGFELRHVSRRSEACYYGLPGRRALLRIAAHSKNDDWVGLTNVVARVTFNGTCLNALGEMRLLPEKLENMVATAIGRYMLRPEP